MSNTMAKVFLFVSYKRLRRHLAVISLLSHAIDLFRAQEISWD